MDNQKLSKPHGTSRKRGEAAEYSARKYLEKKGLELIDQNYLSKFGEIDLIMQDKDALTFVEVRYREIEKSDDSLQSVTPQKQHKIIRTAEQYLCEKALYDEIDCRFDVLAMWKKNEAYAYYWVKDAFQIENNW